MTPSPCIIIADRAGQVYALDAAAEAWVASIGGRCTDALVEILPSEHRPALAAALEEALAGESARWELGLRVWGELRRMRLVVSPMRRGGDVVFVSVRVEDVSAERARTAHLHRLEAALNAVPVGVLIVDSNQPGQPVLWASRGVESLTGLAPLDLLGHPALFLAPAQPGDPAYEELTLALASGREAAVVVRLRRGDTEEPFEAAIACTPVRGAAGAVEHLVLTIGRPDDGAGDGAVETAELLHSSKLDALGQLVGGVAHDFNNVLMAMSMDATFLRQELELSGETEEALEGLADAIGKATTLVRRLLAMSRPQEPEPALTQVDAVVDDSVRMLRRLLQSRIELVVVPPGQEHWAFVDRTILEQALVNFVVNARDAIEGEGTITVGVRGVREGDADLVELYVRDSGPGVPPELREKIFEPFFTTKGSGGTGLGLATVERLVEASNGELLLDEGGPGATFRIRLRRAGSDAPPKRRRPTSHSGLRHPAEVRVLLLEDQDALRRALARPLRRAGYVVVDLGTPMDATHALEERGPFDVLVTDVVLPGQSGLEFAAYARARFPDLRVIFITGYASEEARRAADTHHHRLLTKPFDSRTLALTIVDALSEDPLPG